MGETPAYVYCLFCVTYRCQAIARLLEARGVSRAISPRITRMIRKEGANREEEADLTPGYVFIYHPDDLLDTDMFYGIDGVIRKVGTPRSRYRLEGPDRTFALRLLDRGGLVGAQPICRVGDEIRLVDPLFRECSGRVTHLDYRKLRARVEFTLFGRPCATWVAVEAMDLPEPKPNL